MDETWESKTPTSDNVNPEKLFRLKHILHHQHDNSTTFFDKGQLPTSHPLSWQTIMKNPKSSVDVRLRTHKTIDYHILHTGGFLRLCTSRGRVYWNSQNSTGHLSPDWKLHFSCQHKDIPLAWNVVAASFLDSGCEFGMKATVVPDQDWPVKQHGREITVYIFRNEAEASRNENEWVCDKLPEQLKEADSLNVGETTLAQDVYLSQEYERSWAQFWLPFAVETDAKLIAAGVASRGIAKGDLELDGCMHASLRNEAFVKCERKVDCDERKEEEEERRYEYIYPPNKTGWNAAGHKFLMAEDAPRFEEKGNDFFEAKYYKQAIVWNAKAIKADPDMNKAQSQLEAATKLEAMHVEDEYADNNGEGRIIL